MSKLCRRTDGGVNSGSTADGLRLIDIGSAYGGHLYSRGSMRISLLESSAESRRKCDCSQYWQ